MKKKMFDKRHVTDAVDWRECSNERKTNFSVVCVGLQISLLFSFVCWIRVCSFVCLLVTDCEMYQQIISLKKKSFIFGPEGDFTKRSLVLFLPPSFLHSSLFVYFDSWHKFYFRFQRFTQMFRTSFVVKHKSHRERANEQASVGVLKRF